MSTEKLLPLHERLRRRPDDDDIQAARELLHSIANLLDGVEFDLETGQDIARLLIAAGYVIHAPDGDTRW